MSYVRVHPQDPELVGAAAAISEAARLRDDPEGFPSSPELTALQLTYGWDLDPEESYLYTPEGADAPVGVLSLDLPFRDNLHLVWAGITVHPEHRRRGHGSAMMAEMLRRAKDAGRTTVWIGSADDDKGAQAFLHQFGFHLANRDARRRQVLAEVDHDEVDRLWETASAAAAAYDGGEAPPADPRQCAR